MHTPVIPLETTVLTVRNILITGRLGTSCLAGVAAISIAPVSSGVLTESNLIVFFCMTLATMAGFIWNDIYDFELDQLARKSRPIAKNLLSRETALKVSLILATSILILSWSIFDWSSTVFLALLLIGLAAYSPLSRINPLLKPILVATLSLSPFIFCALIYSISIPPTLLIVIFLYIFFREVILDTLDAKTDKEYGIRTISMITNQRPRLIQNISWFSMISVLSLVVISVQGITSILLVFFALLVHAYSFAIFSNNPFRSILLTRMGMLAAICSILLANLGGF